MALVGTDSSLNWREMGERSQLPGQEACSACKGAWGLPSRKGSCIMMSE